MPEFEWQFTLVLLTNGVMIGLMYALIALGFVLLNKEFDADDNEITRTRKIRRRFVAEKYAAVVDAFYGGEAEVEVATEITYEDGRKSTLTSTIPIEDILEPAQPAREPAYA